MCVTVLVWRGSQRTLEDRAGFCHRAAQCKPHEAQGWFRGGKTLFPWVCLGFFFVVFITWLSSIKNLYAGLPPGNKSRFCIILTPFYWLFVCHSFLTCQYSEFQTTLEYFMRTYFIIFFQIHSKLPGIYFSVLGLRFPSISYEYP